MNIENLVNSETYQWISGLKSPEAVINEVREALLRRLFKFGDLKTSAAWYMSELQAREFAKFMFTEEQRAGSNAQRELELITRLLSKAQLYGKDESNHLAKKFKKFDKDTPLPHDTAIRSINVVDLGPGNGQKARKVIEQARAQFPKRWIRYFPIDASHYMNALALSNIETLPRDNKKLVTYNAATFARNLRRIPDGYHPVLRSLTKSLGDMASALAHFSLDNYDYLTSLNPEQLKSLPEKLKPKIDEAKKYLQESAIHPILTGKNANDLPTWLFNRDAKAYNDHMIEYSHLLFLDHWMDFMLDNDKKQGRELYNVPVPFGSAAGKLEQMVNSLTEKDAHHFDRLDPTVFTLINSLHWQLAVSCYTSLFVGFKTSMIHSTEEDLLGFYLKPDELPKLAEKAHETSKKINYCMHHFDATKDSLIKDVLYAAIIDHLAHFQNEKVKAVGDMGTARILYSIVKPHDYIFADQGTTLDFLAGDHKPVFDAIHGLTTDMHAVNLVMLLGQTFGNFSEEQRKQFLKDTYNSLAWGDYLLLGVELRPDKSIQGQEREEIIERIKDGYRGPEAKAFMSASMNLLGIPYDAWEPEPDYVDDTIKINVRVTKPFTIKKSVFSKKKFNAGDVIPFGESHKFDPQRLNDITGEAGFSLMRPEIYNTPLAMKDGRPISGGDEYALMLFRKGSCDDEINRRIHWGFGNEWKFKNDEKHEMHYFENTGKSQDVDIRDLGGHPINIEPRGRIYFASGFTKNHSSPHLAALIAQDGYRMEESFRFKPEEIAQLETRSAYIIHAVPQDYPTTPQKELTKRAIINANRMMGNSTLMFNHKKGEWEKIK